MTVVQSLMNQKAVALIADARYQHDPQHLLMAAISRQLSHQWMTSFTMASEQMLKQL